MMIGQKVAPRGTLRSGDGRRETITISAILPIAEEETAGAELVRDLAAQTSLQTEIVVAGVEPHLSLLDDIAGTFLGQRRHVTSSAGRAIQMNAGARAASGTYLWFLHADSRLPPGALERLKRAIETEPDALYFFGLSFHDGPAALRLNAFGAKFRSRVLGIPFGDQGLCIRRDLFFELGGFDESIVCGEDHHFVWSARHRGVPLHRVAATLSTSGRKYAENGWARTTVRHWGLTLRQAAPELIRYWTGSP